MLQYLVILLDDTSTSYCHYESLDATTPNPSSPEEGNRSRNPSETLIPHRTLIPLGTLKDGIRFGMKENLMIQFVYPDYDLPEEYKAVVESIDHSKIMPAAWHTPPPLRDTPSNSEGELGYNSEADVWIANSWEELPKASEVPIVIRTSKADFFARYKEIVPLLSDAPRVNVAFTDVETFTDEDFGTYKAVLTELAGELEKLYVAGKAPQLNLLTDRMMLTDMNNCGAGDTTVTLAPNGRFYVCPAFYYEDEADSIGDLEHGLDIKNKQLYKLEYAPICRHCDVWHCRRCIWLNRKLTLEVNTPGREQCVLAHLERNASRELLLAIRKHGTFMPQTEINEIDYIDPFDKRDTWDRES